MPLTFSAGAFARLCCFSFLIGLLVWLTANTFAISFLFLWIVHMILFTEKDKKSTTALAFLQKIGKAQKALPIAQFSNHTTLLQF